MAWRKLPSTTTSRGPGTLGGTPRDFGSVFFGDCLPRDVSQESGQLGRQQKQIRGLSDRLSDRLSASLGRQVEVDEGETTISLRQARETKLNLLNLLDHMISYESY